jgi:hypothetical protein
MPAATPAPRERALPQISLTAPASHQKRPRQSTTNAIEPERKRSKINESDRYSAAHNGLVAGQNLKIGQIAIELSQIPTPETPPA